MRRTIGFVVLWFVAGAVATTVAWLGVSTVSDQLAGSGSHPDPLSDDEISAELAGTASSTTSTSGPEGGGSSTSTTATTVPPPTTTTTERSQPAVTTTVAPPAVQPVTRTYDLEGGTATLRFSPTGVTVVVASPAPGFTVDIGDSHGGGKRVEFESDSHRSRVDAWWDGGPQDEVREDT